MRGIALHILKIPNGIAIGKRFLKVGFGASKLLNRIYNKEMTYNLVKLKNVYIYIEKDVII